MWTRASAVMECMRCMSRMKRRPNAGVELLDLVAELAGLGGIEM